MSRRRAAVPPERLRRSRAEGTPEDPAPDADPGGGRLVGYRLVRRIASGARAELFLAAAETPMASGSQSREAGLADVDAPPGPPLVILRVYRADALDASVALEIEAMSADATGTLPALYDVANLEDGRCVLAVERIAGGPLSRLLAGRTLTPGESVTVLAPIVVAVADLARRGYLHSRLAVSDVLIDDRGRPRLVGLGALRRLPERSHADRTALLRETHAALAELISDVAAAVRPAGALDGVIELIRERLDARPFEPCEAEVERRLFDLALPEPIGGADMRPRAATRLPARVVAPIATEERAERAPLEAPSLRARGRFARTVLELAQVPGEVMAGFGGADDEDRRGLHGRVLEVVARRRRSLTVGGLVGAAALVLLLTLVPPAKAENATEAATGQVAASVDSPAGDPSEFDPGDDGVSTPADSRIGTGSQAAPQDGPAGLDPVAAASGLLDRRAQCFQTLDLSCLDEVVQPGSAAESADRTALIAARDGGEPPEVEFDLSAIAVTTEMGGAVLVSAPRAAGREPASLLMVRGEAGWRLREIFG